MSDKLNVRQKKFVKELAKTGNRTQAVINAGYNAANRRSANSMGTELMAKPKIQNALAEELDRQYPDLKKIASDALYDMLKHESWQAKAKALDLLTKIQGWLAPTKQAKLNVSIQDKFKLPEE